MYIIRMTMHLLNVRATCKKHTSKPTKGKIDQWEVECKQHNKWLKSVGMKPVSLQEFIDQKHGRVKHASIVKPKALSSGLKLDSRHQHIPSLNSSGLAVCAKPAPKVYTGTAMLGIATMHKSNSVPVFNQQEATDVANMRRG